ncbi:UNVERIFIED_CONTAM: hypothetical protein PYX00_011384 [Menopon gallinae]|uniref:Uncharacterized protein n=1 Tax=Menopon gallinae TaxID=328185 RepID=A0AAW2H7D1_9NEOP
MYEFYRQSLVGKALQDVIEEKVQTNKLTPMQAKYIMEKFDSVIPTIFNKTVQNNLNFKGVVKNYNFVDGVWKFVTSDFVMSINNELFRSRQLKIVACDADTSMDYGRRRRRKTFGITKEHWRVFVYHEQTALVMSNLFAISDILNYEIVVVQRLEQERQPVEYPALYFLELDSGSFSALQQDIKRRTYSFYYVVSINKSTYAAKLEKLENVQYKECLLSFVPVESRVFTFSRDAVEDAVLSISGVLGRPFVISYIESLGDVANALYSKQREGESQEDLVLVDRSVDVYIPLIHYFTFQALIADLRLGDFERDDELWARVRHVHIAEINKILSRESKKVIGDAKALDEKDVDQKKLMQLVLKAPEKIKLKESLNTYLDLVDKIFNTYESSIKKVVEVEQSAATRYTASGSRYTQCVSDTMDILASEDITKEDKLRVFLLCAVQYNFQQSELAMLADKGVFTGKEIQLAEEIRKFGFKAGRQKTAHKYDISRYKPALSFIITNLINNQSSLSYLGHKTKASPSLRKTKFAFSENKSKRVICVIFTDSVTWPEVQVVYELSQHHSVDIIVGAPKIVTAAEFIEDLGNGYFFRKNTGHFFARR